MAEYARIIADFTPLSGVKRRLSRSRQVEREMPGQSEREGKKK